ncbi:MAG TPA: TetR/AcrR family transcriptional regulator [Longimicrobiaceae bacterium]|nr:TetR/AcrR family transcriptional regulator [Longimicrobiaceae bacterium]
MTPTAAPAARRSADKREAILAATLRLVARSGLHNAPMSAIAREAGVAVGTAYLYFDGKDALINSLYLAVVRERDATALPDVDAALPAEEQLWASWSRYTHWHLEHRDAANFIQQCEASGILTEETRARQMEIREAGVESFVDSVRRGVLRELPVEVFYALYTGPILVLSHMQDKREIEITDEVLRQTFGGVCRSVLRGGG